MKKIYLLACTFIFSVTVNAVTKTWIGGPSGEWWYSSNWSPAGLPGSGDEIVIDGSTVYLYSTAIVKNVSLYNGAKLIIWSNISLTIPQESLSPQAIYMGSGSTLTVYGNLIIGSSTTANISKGINNASATATISIESGGKISIDRCQTGLYLNGGKLYNEGSLEIGQGGTISTQGILINSGTLQTDGYGIIKIDNVQGPAIATATTPPPFGALRTINNNGILEIGEIGDVTGAGIEAYGATINNSGFLYVNRTADALQLTQGMLTNTNRLIIGSTATVTGSGIVTSGTGIINSGQLIIKNTQGDGLQLTGSNFTNNGTVNIGLNDLATANYGNCGGIGIHTNGTVINNNNYIDFGTVGSHGIQLENNSSFTNSGTMRGGSMFGGTLLYTAIHGNMMVLQHSTFINAVTGQYDAYNTATFGAVDGITLNNSSHVENRGTLKISGPRNISLSLDGNSDFRNYGFLEAYYGLTRSLYVAGGSLFENNTGGSIHFGATLTSGLPLVYITGNGSKLINRDALLVDYGNVHGIVIDQQGSLQNETGGLIQVNQVQQNGFEISSQGKVTNSGTIELNEVTNFPLHVSGAGIIINNGMVKVGNGVNNTKTGIFLEGSDTRLENNAAGQITINKTAAGYNGALLTTGAVFQNDGKITWGTTSTAFQGAAALQLLNNGVFDNRMASSLLEFVNCTNDAIVCDATNAPQSSDFFISGLIKFGNIDGRGFYNSDPNYAFSNSGRLETMTNGKMNLQARIDNSGLISELFNIDGTVTIAYPFSNKGTVMNTGTITNLSAFTNVSGGRVINNGTWKTTGTFNNNINGLCQGSGTFQGSVFKNNFGTVSPGNSPGCLSFAGGFTNQSNGNLAIEVNGKNNPCTQFDRINVTGTATINGQLNVTFGGTYTPVVNDQITILKSSSLSGVFSGHNLPNGWTILYNTPATGDITLSRIATLPLHLLQFSAQKDGEKAHISWTTTDEVNTSHFELERSDNGSQFQKIATIASVNAAGDHSYEFIDQSPLTGRNYYRLKMADIDETFTYSWVVSLDMDKPQAIISAIYPNPATDVVNVVVTESRSNLSIQLISQDGKTVLTKHVATPGTYQVPVATLPAGVYFIKVNNGETYKLVKQ